MGNIIVSIILVIIIGGAVSYIYQAKKSGVKCIGCPHGGKASKKDSDCSCPSDDVKFKIN